MVRIYGEKRSGQVVEAVLVGNKLTVARDGRLLEHARIGFVGRGERSHGFIVVDGERLDNEEVALLESSLNAQRRAAAERLVRLSTSTARPPRFSRPQHHPSPR